jgi:lysophospholipase L1-like esterase
MKKIGTLLLFAIVGFAFKKAKVKPTVYIIGDSTVRNSNRPQCGWGEYFYELMDTTKITISNQAMAGRSTRTFIKEKRWDKVLETLKAGDFVIMQFGHNEGSRPDTSRAGYRGVLRGIGDEMVSLTWKDSSIETVHTYGWYLKKFVNDAKAKGATPIICSMIPRNEFRNTPDSFTNPSKKVIRANKDYGKWAMEVAQNTNAYFVDLNKITADKYDALEPEVVKNLFYGDHTHTNVEGAKLNAESVADGMKNKLVFLLLISVSFIAFKKDKIKPTLYIIGDSTVKNGDGTGKNNQMGWGTVIPPFFDTSKINIENHAIGGRSSRTFISDGRWDKILETLKTGDYVLMQFGHNDASPLDDTARARGTIRGIGTESKEIYNPIKKIKEVVYTYGFYMRKFVQDAKAKGAIPIMCSLVPRNGWKDGKVNRSSDNYALWAKQVAEQEGIKYIELNGLIANAYDKMGQEAVKKFFIADNTHTSNDGAILNAKMVVKGIRKVKPGKLKKYLR